MEMFIARPMDFEVVVTALVLTSVVHVIPPKTFITRTSKVNINSNLRKTISVTHRGMIVMAMSIEHALILMMVTFRKILSLVSSYVCTKWIYQNCSTFRKSF